MKDMSLPKLLMKIGADKLKYQMLNTSITNIKLRKGYSEVSFGTEGLTPNEHLSEQGNVGIVVWIDRKIWNENIKDLK